MKVLGLDTSTTGCSAALWADGAIVARRALEMARGQAEALVPLAQAAVSEAGLRFTDLDRIAVTVGPGAFTGLRIALAAARGFARACGVPAVGVSTFAAVAHAVPPAERAGRHLLVAVDSRRQEPFLQRFDEALRPCGEPAMLDPAEVGGWLPAGPLLVAGDGAAALRAALVGRPDTAWSSAHGAADAAAVATLGARAADPDGNAWSAAPPRPLYLRAPDVTPPRTVA